MIKVAKCKFGSISKKKFDIFLACIILIYMRLTLKQIIKSKGYRPSQIADTLGFHRTTLYNHLRGDNILGIARARKLATFLGISIEEVYYDN